MKVTIDNGYLCVRLYDLIGAISRDEALSLADAVSVRDDVIVYVTQQILDGLTDLGSRAGRVIPTAVEPTGLDWAIREVAKQAGDVARQEIERLERNLGFVERELAECRALLQESRAQRCK